MSWGHISKVLIANRGEIACRVMRTTKLMGIESVAVYSEADKNALHVKLASEAHFIGPASSQQSYLRAEKLLDIAVRSNCQAIHPGYGFLSENAEFASLCKSKNVIFIGPPESAIRDMGIKSTSKLIMETAGVPVIKGYHGSDQTKETLFKEAKKIGFPVMIKAVRGGGGKGMRIAINENQFFEQLESAKREALKSFNDDVVLLEKFIETPRHVEVQIFGDSHGNYVHLCERDCSVQRRHQKIIEEAPGPGITPEIRDRLGKAAVLAAAAVNYVGAGTVEFIMDANHDFFFMEMNTRLQVEHPVTEMITGIDLVEWQLRVAAGERLPITDQSLLQPKGHAFEARIYAEDCSNPNAFMPTAGKIQFMKLPTSNKDNNVRIDTGVVEGDEISVHYDPMIAKLIVWSHDRQSALSKLVGSLKSYQIVGLPTNIEFLQNLASNQAFINGSVHTDFIKQHSNDLFIPITISAKDFCVAAVVSALIDSANPIINESSDDRHSPFSQLSAFRVNHNYLRQIKLKNGTMESVVLLEQIANSNNFIASADLNGISTSLNISGSLINGTGSAVCARIIVDGRIVRLDAYRDALDLHIFVDGQHYVFASSTEGVVLGSRNHLGDDDSLSGQFGISPMPGVIEKLLVNKGQKVKKGDALLTMIAMKMEYTIRAGCNGTIKEINISEGDIVAKSVHLIEIMPEQ